jgi:hypothetical protein
MMAGRSGVSHTRFQKTWTIVFSDKLSPFHLYKPTLYDRINENCPQVDYGAIASMVRARDQRKSKASPEFHMNEELLCDFVIFPKNPSLI